MQDVPKSAKKGFLDFVYRTRWQSDPDMFTRAPKNKLSVRYVAKYPDREEEKYN